MPMSKKYSFYKLYEEVVYAVLIKAVSIFELQHSLLLAFTNGQWYARFMHLEAVSILKLQHSLLLASTNGQWYARFALKL